MALIGRPARNCDSSVRSSRPHPASSVTSRWAVETGRPVRRAISVSECRPPSWNVSKIAATLLVTERPGSVALPAIMPPHQRLTAQQDLWTSNLFVTRSLGVAWSWTPNRIFMEVLEAFGLTGGLRAAAALAECDHKTVAHYVALGRGAGPGRSAAAGDEHRPVPGHG